MLRPTLPESSRWIASAVEPCLARPCPAEKARAWLGLGLG
jgi:hypothetical protein